MRIYEEEMRDAGYGARIMEIGVGGKLLIRVMDFQGDDFKLSLALHTPDTVGLETWADMTQVEDLEEHLRPWGAVTPATYVGEWVRLGFLSRVLPAHSQVRCLLTGNNIQRLTYRAFLDDLD